MNYAILTFILIVSILFFIDELFKSFTTGMWELEQTLKYELRQHTIVKLLIMGLIDMILVFLMSIIVQPTLSISLLNILLYLLVPYNLICIILFSILTMWRNKCTIMFYGLLLVQSELHLFLLQIFLMFMSKK